MQSLSSCSLVRAAGRPDLADKVAQCRRQFSIDGCDDCGAESTGRAVLACGDRLCVLCSAQRREHHIARTKDVIRSRRLAPDDLAMITLTVTNVETITSDTWRELAARFNALRAWLAALLGDDVLPGGLRASEVTYRGERSGYHVHLHVVAELPRPIAQSVISDCWFAATAGAGYVADVRRLYARRSSDPVGAGLREVVKRTSDGAVKVSEGVELVEQQTEAALDAEAGAMATRYVVKLLDVSDPEALVRIHDSLTGVRIVERFGAWRRAGEEDEPEPDDPSEEDLDDDGDEHGLPCPMCGGRTRRVGARRLSWWASARALARARRAARAAWSPPAAGRPAAGCRPEPRGPP